MKPFLLDGDAHFQKPTAYYMYRNVGLTEDVALLNCNHLRYDLTVLESGRIGREFVKTIGHYHPLKPGTNMQYPEIYEVIHGVAVLVIQKANNVEHKVSDACLAKITAPAKVVIPSGYGHVTVNIGSKPLVLANLVSDQFSSLYEPYRKMRGASYYIVA
jgi:glucose-6-phosphate isomerase